MTSSGERGYARIEPDGQAYQNSYVKPGQTVRVALCGKCMDTGRELTDDGTRGPMCDCSYGFALAPSIPRPLCRAACPSHDRTCQEYEGDHQTNHGSLLHVCNGGHDGRSHNFYQSEVAS